MRWFQSNLLEVFVSLCARERCRGGGGFSAGPPSVSARCKAGKRIPEGLALSTGRDTAGEGTPFKKKKSGASSLSFSMSVQLIVWSNDYFIRAKVVL